MNPRERLERFNKLLAPPPEGSQDGLSAREVGQREEERREMIREMALGGVPDHPPSLRPLAYHLLLALPPPPTLLAQYTAFIDEIGARLGALPDPVPGTANELKEDRLLREIERDVGRTFGGLAWFGAPGEQRPALDGEGEEGKEDPFWARIRKLEEMETQVSTEMASGGSRDAMQDGPPAAEAIPVKVDATDESASQDAAPALSINTTAHPASLSAPPTATIELTPPTPTTFRAFEPALGTDETGPRPRNRRETLLRPLVVYGVLNPALGYVQGMNSLAAVFFRVFASVPGRGELEAEACAFFALGAVLSQVRDLYVASLDGTISPSGHIARPSSPLKNSSFTPTGLGATLTRFSTLLLWLDPELAGCLERKEVNPAFFLVRWLTTLFANEFELPDLLRIWDRIISLYPSPTSAPSDEALSPVLGHLLDLALALCLSRKSTLISPFANPLITLQDLQVSGEAVDKLLASSWEIRERRLGRATLASNGIATPTGGSPLKAASAISGWKKWGQQAAQKASQTTAGTGWGARLWNGTGNPAPAGESSSEVSPAHASEFDLDESASVAESERSTGSGFGFLSRAQRAGASELPPVPGSPSRKSVAATSDELEILEGKTLPPPPARIDEREALDSLVELELPPTPTENDSGSGSDDDEEGRGLTDRALEGFAGWKANLSSRLAASDAAAALSKQMTNAQIAAAVQRDKLAKAGDSDAAAALQKATTNAAIRAQVLREQMLERGAGLDRIRENVVAASGRLRASTGSEIGGGYGTPARPGSPVNEPFTPPTLLERAKTIARARSPSAHGPDSPEMSRQGSNGPKPLLLSASARRASNASNTSDSAAGLSSPGSRRQSLQLSPTLARSPPPNRNEAVSPLGFTRAQAQQQTTPTAASGHGRSTSAFASPSPRAYGGTHVRSASTASQSQLVSPRFASNQAQPQHVTALQDQAKQLEDEEAEVLVSPPRRAKNGSSSSATSFDSSASPLQRSRALPSLSTQVESTALVDSPHSIQSGRTPPPPSGAQASAFGSAAFEPMEMGFAIPMSESKDQPESSPEVDLHQPSFNSGPATFARQLQRVTLTDGPSPASPPPLSRPVSLSGSVTSAGIREVSPSNRSSMHTQDDSPGGSPSPSRHSSLSSHTHPSAASPPASAVGTSAAEQDEQPLSRDGSLKGGAQGIQRSKIVRRPGVRPGGGRRGSARTGSVTGSFYDGVEE